MIRADGQSVNVVNPYPVGAIYMSVDSTNPSTLFGGTWQQIQDTFLLACGSTYTAGDTGGEATHTLTEQEIPSHTHRQNANASSAGGSSSGGGRIDPWVQGNNYGTAHVSYTGGGQAHNNMPPYLAVYMWQRTA